MKLSINKYVILLQTLTKIGAYTYKAKREKMFESLSEDLKFRFMDVTQKALLFDYWICNL